MKIKAARQMAIDEIRVEIDSINELLPGLKKERAELINSDIATMWQQWYWKDKTKKIKEFSARLKAATQEYKRLLALTNLDEYEISEICQPIGIPMEYVHWGSAYWVQFYICSKAVFRIRIPVRDLFWSDKSAVRVTRAKMYPREKEVFARHVEYQLQHQIDEKDDWPRRPSWDWIMKIPPCMAKYIWNDTVDPEDAIVRLTGEDIWTIFQDPCRKLTGVYYDGMGYKEYAYGAGYMPDGSCRIVTGNIRRNTVICHEFTDGVNAIKPLLSHDSTGNTIYTRATWGKRLMMFFECTLRNSGTMKKHWKRYHKNAWWWLRKSNESTVEGECRVDKFKETEMNGVIKSFV